MSVTEVQHKISLRVLIYLGVGEEPKSKKLLIDTDFPLNTPLLAIKALLAEQQL